MNIIEREKSGLHGFCIILNVQYQQKTMRRQASSEVFLKKLKVNLLGKDAKSAILNMFRELKESIRMVLN